MSSYFLAGHGHVRDGDGDGAEGGVLVAGGLDGVQHLGGHGEAVLVDGAVHDLAQLLLAAGEADLVVAGVLGVGAVHEAQVLGDGLVEDDAADGGLHQLCGLAVQVCCGARRWGVQADDVVV